MAIRVGICSVAGNGRSVSESAAPAGTPHLCRTAEPRPTSALRHERAQPLGSDGAPVVHPSPSVFEVRTVQPRHTWELALPSYRLISAALALRRPFGVRPVRERRGGDDEETVVARYNDLMVVIEEAPWATDDVLARLRITRG
jgi:hypothetical protein